jgi:hypothetical protein
VVVGPTGRSQGLAGGEWWRLEQDNPLGRIARVARAFVVVGHISRNVPPV